MTKRFDAVKISLLTCEPHTEVYSLYGHTAIRIVDSESGDDFVVNYGVFNSQQKNFVWHFILGETDYEVGIYPTDIFCKEYENEGRYVVEQELNLLSEEKQRIIRDIAVNAQPENKIYRYNIFYNNCTTRARDVILKNIDGHVLFPPNDDFLTFRQMTRECAKDHLWTRFGNDMLLGLKADFNTNAAERQFLPERLMHAMDSAYIQTDDGKTKKLIASTTTLVESAHNLTIADSEITKDIFSYITPSVAAIILAVIIMSLTIVEIFTGYKFRWLDLLLTLSCGLVGVLLTLMWFSQHPTVKLNFLWLLFCPLLLIFGISASKNSRHWLWKMWSLMIIFLLIGAFFQQYADGIMILALSLLARISLLKTSFADFLAAKMHKETK